jgi:hypothetical protein
MTEQIPAPIYQIKIAGVLDPGWSAWLDGLALAQESADPPITTLTGAIVDQARLRGILNALWDLNQVILAVNVLR